MKSVMEIIERHIYSGNVPGVTAYWRIFTRASWGILWQQWNKGRWITSLSTGQSTAGSREAAWK
jgi:hypothetical protein